MNKLYYIIDNKDGVLVGMEDGTWGSPATIWEYDNGNENAMKFNTEEDAIKALNFCKEHTAKDYPFTFTIECV